MRVIVIVIGVSQLQIAYPKDDRSEVPVTNKELSKAMSKAHRGQKSSHASVVRELKKELPGWEQLAKDATVFVDMGKMFNRRGPFVSTSPKLYIESADELVTAGKAKDKAAAMRAFSNLKKSCVACHREDPIQFDDDGNVK